MGAWAGEQKCGIGHSGYQAIGRLRRTEMHVHDNVNTIIRYTHGYIMFLLFVECVVCVFNVL